MKNGVRVDTKNKEMILIDTTESYFLFSESHFILFGRFLADILEELFSFYVIGERAILEVVNESGFPKVLVSGSLRFQGKENGNEGILDGVVATLALTYFLQKHMVHLLSESESFTNKNYLEDLIKNTSSLKISADDFSNDEQFQLYKFWD